MHHEWDPFSIDPKCPQFQRYGGFSIRLWSLLFLIRYAFFLPLTLNDKRWRPCPPIQWMVSLPCPHPYPSVCVLSIPWWWWWSWSQWFIRKQWMYIIISFVIVHAPRKRREGSSQLSCPVIFPGGDYCGVLLGKRFCPYWEKYGIFFLNGWRLENFKLSLWFVSSFAFARRQDRMKRHPMEFDVGRSIRRPHLADTIQMGLYLLFPQAINPWRSHRAVAATAIVQVEFAAEQKTSKTIIITDSEKFCLVSMLHFIRGFFFQINWTGKVLFSYFPINFNGKI